MRFITADDLLASVDEEGNPRFPRAVLIGEPGARNVAAPIDANTTDAEQAANGLREDRVLPSSRAGWSNGSSSSA